MYQVPFSNPGLPDYWWTLYPLGQWAGSKISRTGASLSDAVWRHTQDTSSIWPIHWTLTGITTPGQSGYGSNGNEEVLHITQSSSRKVSLADSSESYPGHMLGGSLRLCRDAVNVINSTRWLGWNFVLFNKFNNYYKMKETKNRKKKQIKFYLAIMSSFQ